MAYHTTANGEIYIEQNGVDVLLLQDTAAAILNEKDARIAELERERDAAIADALVLAEYISTPILVSADGNYQENAVVDSIVEKYWNLQQKRAAGATDALK